MQPSSTSRSVLVYGLVALVLFGAVLLGVQLVRNRNTIVASTQPPTAQPTGQQPTNNPSTPAPTTSTPTPSSTPASPSNKPVLPQPTHVPATGADDVMVAAVALGSAVWMVFLYRQSRRRLTTLA
jgi:cytoskeletal protein RodZ